MTNKKTALFRRFEGQVVHVGQKTIGVLVATTQFDSKYNKRFASTKKYQVHDEKNLAKEGDKVLIEECKPMSKTKKWSLVSVLDGSALGGKVIK